MKLLIIIFSIINSAFSLSQTKVISHNSYPVKDFIVHLDKETVVKLSSIRMLNGDSPIDYVKYEPNYATFFEIVEWSCGSPCKESVVIDLRNGKIIGSINFCYGLNYNLSSTLIAVDDLDENSLCKRAYYNLIDDVLKQIN